MTEPVSTDPLAIQTEAQDSAEGANARMDGGAGVVIKGMTWVASSNILSRSISLVGQVVTAWLLVPEDYGAYAFAIAEISKLNIEEFRITGSISSILSLTLPTR